MKNYSSLETAAVCDIQRPPVHILRCLSKSERKQVPKLVVLCDIVKSKDVGVYKIDTGYDVNKYRKKISIEQYRQVTSTTLFSCL